MMTIPLACFALYHSVSDALSPPLIVFLVVGVGLFIAGFRKYRKYRLIEDMPVTPVRSAAIGLVHVMGKPTGPKVLTTPLTKLPCFHFYTVVEELVRQASKDDRADWQAVAWDQGEEAFFLEDQSGRILVAPHTATFDIPDVFTAEIGPARQSKGSPGHMTRKVDTSLEIPVPSEEDVLTYLNKKFQVPDKYKEQYQVALKEHPTLMAMMGFGPGERPKITLENCPRNYRIRENCLVAGRTHLIVGTCAENPAKEEEARKVIRKGENERTFLITSKTERQIEKGLLRQAGAMVLVGGAIIIGTFALMLYSLGAF
jgi:hypothetical protein